MAQDLVSHADPPELTVHELSHVEQLEWLNIFTFDPWLVQVLVEIHALPESFTVQYEYQLEQLVTLNMVIFEP